MLLVSLNGEPRKETGISRQVVGLTLGQSGLSSEPHVHNTDYNRLQQVKYRSRIQQLLPSS